MDVLGHDRRCITGVTKLLDRFEKRIGDDLNVMLVEPQQGITQFGFRPFVKFTNNLSRWLMRAAAIMDSPQMLQTLVGDSARCTAAGVVGEPPDVSVPDQ